ncbi:MAG TPA: CPBP family glutamic-type intramembrane protease [Candidatus Eisenbacteria bacterium]
MKIAAAIATSAWWRRASVWVGGAEPFTYLALLLFYIWWFEPRAGAGQNVAARVLLGILPILSSLLHRDRPRDVGLRVDNLLRSARQVGEPSLVAAALILTIGGLTGTTPRFDLGTVYALAGYPVWALWQQFVLQGFVHRRLALAWGRPRQAAAVAALVFGLVHLPNPVLMVATTWGGYLWCRYHARTPNLVTLAISHGWLATLLSVSLPSEWLHQLVVGPGYWPKP